MFLDLFYGLREQGVPVSIQEWRTLMEALGKGLHQSNLLRFYYLARACLVKSEAFYDAFDRTFLHVFAGVEGEFDLTDQVLEWLKDPKQFPELTPEQRAALEQLTHDELMRRFLETLAKQTERHDGGDRWIGTGGRSPFGHGGEHPTGIRVGGESGRHSAMKVAEERHFRNYRTDETLDVRKVKIALRRLRQFTRTGPDCELDLDETVDETCKNGGEIEIVLRPERRNDLRLLLLMDVGGTMDPYYEPVSRLLTALHEEHGLRALETYYFHNCVYDNVYVDAGLYRKDAVPTAEILRKLGERWKVMFVGDAAMHPGELLQPFGNIHPSYESETTGITWLQRIEKHFERCVWINPDSSTYWDHTHTTRTIRNLFPMYPLTIDGISDAIRALVGARH